MKPNVLRTPLINSAIVLFLISMMVYFTTTSPEGGLWGSIGSIVMLVFRTVQLAIGLALGLFVCLVVLIGIFLGSVALFNLSTASRMYEALRQIILAWIASMTGLVTSERKEEQEAGIQDIGAEMKQDMAAVAQGARSEIDSARSELEEKLMSLSSRLSAVEESSGSMASTEQVAELATEVSGSGETLTRLENSVKTVQDGLNKVTQQVQDITPEKLLGDITGRVETLEQQDAIAGMQAELAEIRKDVEKSAAAEQEAPAGKDAGEEHRIFSYFDDPADRKKLAELVAGTLKKDMTYGQVMDYLAKELGPELGNEITEHPSLAKDYIRQCRRAG